MTGGRVRDDAVARRGPPAVEALAVVERTVYTIAGDSEKPSLLAFSTISFADNDAGCARIHADLLKPVLDILANVARTREHAQCFATRRGRGHEFGVAQILILASMLVAARSSRNISRLSRSESAHQMRFGNRSSS